MIVLCSRCKTFIKKIEPTSDLSTIYGYCDSCVRKVYLHMADLEKRFRYVLSVEDKLKKL